VLEELSLRYESLLLIAETTNDIDFKEEKALFMTQFKGKCRNYGKLGQIVRLDMINSKGLRIKCHATTARKLVITRMTVSSL
jgi:hypothetical protein